MSIIELPEPIIFEWDMGNFVKSYKKHNITTEEAEQVFFTKHLLKKDDLHSTTEDRFHLIGPTDNDKMLLISFTVRGKKIRVISARPADKHERKIYEKAV